MPLKNSYAVWNNKGGVGKSTITFHIASRYAQLHPNEKVLVIDLCPQANSSMMLLGGGEAGERQVIAFCTEQAPPTVAGYLSYVLSAGPMAPLPPHQNYLKRVADYNREIPSNTYLLCGDGNLEPMSPLISAQAGMAPLTSASNPWLWVHQIFRTLIGKLSEGPEDWVIFVDTNPSFSIYTEIAISSVDKLIVPVNADDSSRVATNAMFTLIYGANPPHPIYGAYTFANKANQLNLPRPVVHLIVGNRLTQNMGAAAAFEAVSDATAESLFYAYQQNPGHFTPYAKLLKTINAFRTAYSLPLRDFNTAGVVAAHSGRPLSNLPSGNYDVYGTNVQVSVVRVRECLDAIDNVVARL
ncbi:MAG: ParA family protein [Proteobacteria bacterium]|nr:MAG: ParA family protein [Pseudomonadota bacterium]